MANNSLKMSTNWNDDEMYKLFFNSNEGEILQNLPDQLSLTNSFMGNFTNGLESQLMQDNNVMFDSPLGSPGSDASFTQSEIYSSPEYSSDCASPTETVPMQTTVIHTEIKTDVTKK